MYNVTQDFKNAVESVSRQIRGKVTIDSVDFLDDDNLQSIEIERGTQTESSFIGNTISKKYIIKVIDTERNLSFEGSRVIPYLGVTLENDTVEYVPFAPADVYTAEFDTVSKVWTLTCYDDMQKLSSSLIKYMDSVIYPLTLQSYAEAVCSMAGLTLSTNTFYNYDLNLLSEPNLSGEETLREVIGYIAQAGFCNAVINRDGELEFVSGIQSGTAVKDIEGDHYYNYTLDSRFGPVNSLVLSRAPQEDNVYSSDQTSIDTNGLTELRIENNPFLDYGDDDKRYDIIGDMFTEVSGFTYYAYALEWRGDPSLDPSDRIAIFDVNDVSISTNYYNDVISFTGGLKSTSNVSLVEASDTNYEAASSIRNTLQKTVLQVDKLNNDITSTVQNIESINNEITSEITTIKQTSENIMASLSKTGGANTIRNSAFYKNTDYWETSDPISFNLIRSTEVELNTVSGSELELIDGTLSQTFNVIEGEIYTLAFSYKKEALVTGNISYVRLYSDETNYEELINTDVEQESRQEVTYTFTASSSTPKIEIYTDDDKFYITDLRNIVGDTAQVWSQYKDEVYGKGVILDQNGLIINDYENENSASLHADNNSLYIQNSENEIVSELSDQKVHAPSAEFEGDVILDEILISHLSSSRIIIARSDV